MVSNTLEIDLQELLDTLDTMRREFGDSPEYRKWRSGFPEDWPI
jgi:hypothetical protein